MNGAQPPPDPSPVNSPQSGKVKSLKARWMKTFNEDNCTNRDSTFVDTDEPEIPVASLYSNFGSSHPSAVNDGRNLSANQGREAFEPVMPQLEAQVPFTVSSASSSSLSQSVALQNTMSQPVALQNVVQNNAAALPAQSTADLQYRLAQAQAQLGVLPNAMPMSLKQQSDLIKHAIELEQQSQMIKQAMLLYLAQAELAKETNGEKAQVTPTALLNSIPQSCEANPGLVRKDIEKQVAYEGVLTPPKWQTHTLNGAGLMTNVSSPAECQPYPNSSRSEVCQVPNGVLEPVKTLNQERLPNFAQQRRPSFPPRNIPSTSFERRLSFPLERPCNMAHAGQPNLSQTGKLIETATKTPVNSRGQASCPCTQNPSPPSVVSKVSKEMGIQTDNLASTLPVNSPKGGTIDQALQLLQSSQPYDICKNWLAKHVPMPSPGNCNVTSSVSPSASSPSPQGNSPESHNSPLELLQASVANPGLNLAADNPKLDTSPIDMTVQVKNDMVVSSTDCNQKEGQTMNEEGHEASGGLDVTVTRPPDNKCPVCGDIVSGYHYGIYSCESCKGFFKRTVQSKRNERLRCGRGDTCAINIDSRKHCAACRFNKCLYLGMKLQAIRGDRQRGGRSMYLGSSEFRRRQELSTKQKLKPAKRRRRVSTVKKLGPPPQPVMGHPVIKQEPGDNDGRFAGCSNPTSLRSCLISEGHGLLALPAAVPSAPAIDPMLKEFIKAEEDLINQEGLMKCCVEAFEENQMGDLFTAACHLMDHQLYTFVKWARTLPLYKELKTEDQIVLMQRRGLHLMAITLCFYFIDAEDKIILPTGRKVQFGNLGDENLEDIVRRLVETAGRFRGINLDKYQLVCLKGIMLLNPVSKGLIEVEQVQDMQEKMEDLLIEYVQSQPHLEEKVTGELLLRLSEIERVCQLIREEVCKRKAESRLGNYPLLMELFQDKPSWLY